MNDFKVNDEVRVLEMAIGGEIEVGTVDFITQVGKSGAVRVGDTGFNCFLGGNGGKLELVKHKSKVYTQEMADNGVLPSVGMMCNFAIVGGLWQDVHVDHISDVFIVVTDSKGDQDSFLIEDSRFNPESTPTITLIDGKAYQFDYGNTKEIVGLYSKQSKQLQAIAGHYESKHCVNIKPLTVEGK